MLYTLWDNIKYAYESFKCKKCGYQAVSALKLINHIRKEHEPVFKKGYVKYFLKYNLVSRTLRLLVSAVLFPIFFAVKVICIPFVILDEIL